MKITISIWLTLLLILPINAYALQVLKCRSQGHTLSALEFKKVNQDSRIYKIIQKIDPIMFECIEDGINGLIKDRSTDCVFAAFYDVNNDGYKDMFVLYTHLCNNGNAGTGIDLYLGKSDGTWYDPAPESMYGISHTKYGIWVSDSDTNGFADIVVDEVLLQHDGYDYRETDQKITTPAIEDHVCFPTASWEGCDAQMN